MSQPSDDGRHLLKMRGNLASAIQQAREDAAMAAAGEVMLGDATYAAHCRAIVAYLEGFRDGREGVPQ